MLPPAIFLMGPTASGKTALAMCLYDTLPCEIISVDSVLIYRGMNIGAAKPSVQELQAYPHHLVDILDPAASYSVAEFRRDALALMHEISQRGKIPLLVGGTMMYFKMLLTGVSQVPKVKPSVREELLLDAAKLGWPALHERLKSVDKEAALRIHPNDPQRLQRALEVYYSTGKSLSDWHKEAAKERLPYQILQLAIAPSDRKILHRRIEARFDHMLSLGFAEEVKQLKQRQDLHDDLPSIRAVGYQQMWHYLDGQYDWQAMRDKGIAASRQLAKRQLTWLRSWHELNWLYTDQQDEKAPTQMMLDRLQKQVLQLVNQGVK